MSPSSKDSESFGGECSDGKVNRPKFCFQKKIWREIIENVKSSPFTAKGTKSL